MDAVKFQSFKAEKLSLKRTQLTAYQKKNLSKKTSHFDMLKKFSGDNKHIRVGPQYQKMQHLEESVRRHAKIYEIDDDFNFDQNLRITTEMNLSPNLKWKHNRNRKNRK